MATVAFGGEHANGWGDAGLLACFNRDFGTALVDVDVLKRLLGSRTVRAWQAGWKVARARALALPTDWQALGLTAEEWEACQAGRRARKQARAQYSQEVSAAAATYKAAVTAAEATLQGRLGSNDTPLLRALELGYEDLDIHALLRVEVAADRDAALGAEVEAIRRAAIALLPPVITTCKSS